MQLNNSYVIFTKLLSQPHIGSKHWLILKIKSIQLTSIIDQMQSCRQKCEKKTNKTVQQLNYLMGILHRHPTQVSHLINQTEPHLQFDQSYIYHRKEKKRWWQEPTLLHAKHYSGKRNKNSKINNLTLNQLTTRTLSRDVLLHYHGTNLPEYIPQIWFYTSIQFQERNLSLEKWRGPKQGGGKKKQALHKITCNCFVFEYV